MPKLTSLEEMIMNFETDLCIVTETWTRQDDGQINEKIEDFENRTNFKLLHRARSTNQRGGGVGILFDRTKIDLRTVKTVRSDFEVLAAIGRRVGQRCKVLVVVVYVPPSYDSETSEECLKYINNTLIQLRGRYNDPFVIVGGDFNKRDIKKATQDFPDIKPVHTPPTRGRNVLDIIATNANDLVVDCGVSEAIQSKDGVASDHKTVFCSLRMARVPEYVVEKYSYLHENQAGKNKFHDWMKKQSWQPVLEAVSPSDKVEALQALFREGESECFERKTRSKKSTEPPWITDEIRDWIRRRRKIFWKEKKSQN